MNAYIKRRLADAPIYRKTAKVNAVQVSSGDVAVETRLSDGTVETKNVAHQGDWIVTNPDGERYVVKNDRFPKLYRHLRGETYQAIGRVRAVRNPYKAPIEIETSWGSQKGDRHCWLVSNVDTPGKVHIVGGYEFQNTYEKE